jgi:hypothetical protein
MVLFEEWLVKAMREPQAPAALDHLYNEYVLRYSADCLACRAAAGG